MAKNDYSDLGFTPQKDTPTQDHSDLGFVPHKTLQQVSPLESLARGAAQGATFGFEDELGGGIGAGSDLLSGKADFNTIVDAYRKHRDAERAANASAENSNPKTYTGGNLAGGLVPALLSGGAGAASEATTLAKILQAAKVGAAGGAVAGLGTSDADLTKGEGGRAALDTAEGTVSGAALGGLLQGGIETAKGVGKALKGAGKFIADTDVGHNFGKSLEYGKQGDNYITRSGVDAVEEKTRQAAKDLAAKAEEMRASAGADIGAGKKAVQESGKSFDVSDEIDQIKTVIKQLKESDNPDAINDVVKLQKYLDNLTLGKEVEVPVQYSKFTPGKAIDAKPSAKELLELEAAKAKASAGALGQDLQTSVVPSEDEAGNKLLTLLKSTDENVGASERAIPVKDSNGNVVDNLLDSGDTANNFKSNATAKTIMDTPAVEAGFTPSEKGPVVSEMQKMRQGGSDPSNVGFDKAQDIKSTLNNFNGVSGGAPTLSTNEAINATKLVAKRINDKISQIPELAKANKDYALTKSALEDLGLDSTSFKKNPLTGVMELDVDAENKLNNVISRMSKNTQAGDNASVKISSAVGKLKGVNANEVGDIASRVSNSAESLDLAQKARGLGLQNKSTYLKSGSAYLGNAVGLGIKSITEATPDQLKTIAKELVGKGAMGMRLAQELAETMKKDNVGRNASLFALQQNPEYRKMLKPYVGDNSDK